MSGRPTPLLALPDPVLEAAGVQLWLKREEQRHPLLGGNKWPKLLGHLRAANGRTLVGFGGAWSNHLHALAAAGMALGLATVGVVRGGRDTAMLADCRAMGMQLLPVSHGDYRRRDEPDWIQSFLASAGLAGAWVIPEGGGGAEGLPGFAELAAELAAEATPDTVFALAMGTGTSVAGVAAHLPATARVWGFPVLPLPGIEAKLAASLQVVANPAALTVWHGLVDKAYGRLTLELRQFMEDFEHRHDVALDPVYTVKLLWVLHALAGQGRLPRGIKIIALHSGGLQGRRGHALPFFAALAA